MNILKRNNNLIFCLLFSLSIDVAVADQCPSAKIVKERKISRDYEWTIDERRTLEEVLSVEKLYSVRIKNQGEYVACSYTRKNGLIRLDGAAKKSHCLIMKQSGSWIYSGNGEQICTEKELNLCQFNVICESDAE